jgi:heme/copper-type cytochrome/quinol oxidase subunit 3
MRKLIIIALMFMAFNLLAESARPGTSDEETVHFAAHFGMSYAISMFTYGIAEKAFRFDKTDAMIFSVVSTLMVGAAYEVLQEGETNNPNFGQDFKKAMFRNAAGIAAFGVTVKVFDF